MRFELIPIAPFRLDLTAWCLKRRPSDVLHRWNGETFERVITIYDASARAIPKSYLISVTQSGTPSKPRLEVEIPETRSERVRTQAETIISHILGLDIDLSDFYRLADRDTRVSKLISRFKGLKPPRFPSIFETFVCSVACQQLTLQVGITLLNRLVERFGVEPCNAGDIKGFALPETLANADPDDLQKMSFSKNKASYIIGMAENTARGQIKLESFSDLPDAELMDALMSLRGIGRWSAQYMMLRGFGRLNAFPLDDTGARAKLTKLLGLSDKISWERLEHIASQWKPYEGMLYFHLLMHAMEEEGLLK